MGHCWRYFPTQRLAIKYRTPRESPRRNQLNQNANLSWFDGSHWHCIQRIDPSRRYKQNSLALHHRLVANAMLADRRQQSWRIPARWQQWGNRVRCSQTLKNLPLQDPKLARGPCLVMPCRTFNCPRLVAQLPERWLAAADCAHAGLGPQPAGIFRLDRPDLRLTINSNPTWGSSSPATPSN